MQFPAASGDAFRVSPGLDEEARSDAVDVLRDVAEWTVPEDRWAAVEKAVDALAAALEGGDADAVNAATGRLERLSPYRAVPLGDAVLLAVPEPLRERVGLLVHALERPAPPAEPDADGC